jgi:hypothetical protein
MSDQRTHDDYCIICGVYLPIEQDVYDVRVFLDPMPARGVACSERCAEQAKRAGKIRSYLAFDLLGKK